MLHILTPVCEACYAMRLNQRCVKAIRSHLWLLDYWCLSLMQVVLLHFRAFYNGGHWSSIGGGGMSRKAGGRWRDGKGRGGERVAVDGIGWGLILPPDSLHVLQACVCILQFLYFCLSFLFFFLSVYLCLFVSFFLSFFPLGLTVLRNAALRVRHSSELSVEGIFPLELSWVLTPLP